MINSAFLTPPSLLRAQNKLGQTNSIAFRGNLNTTSFYSNFEKEMKEAYGDSAFKDVLNDAMADSNNKIGEGGEKVVYQIPFVDNYLVAKIKAREHVDAPIKQADDNLSELEYNFGQPIATNGKDIIVMQKVNGESYSVDNWLFTFIAAAQGRKQISESQAQSFLKQIEQISDFPVSSYVSLAKQVKCLSKNDIKMDCFNPNNLLIDWDKKEINHIDIMDGQERFDELKKPLNSVYDMVNLLCDAFLNLSYLEALDNDDAEKLKKATQKVIRKCHFAANVAGLNKDNTNVKEACRISDETSLKAHGMDPLFVDAYNEFENFYSEDLDVSSEKEHKLLSKYYNPYYPVDYMKKAGASAF